MKTGEELIAEERARQIHDLGHTPGHDDQHRDGSLGKAGRCYIATAEIQMETGRALPPCFIHKDWPWERRDWNPARTNPVPNMVKGAALLRAEFERLSRLPNVTSKQLEAIQAEETAAADKINAWLKTHPQK